MAETRLEKYKKYRESINEIKAINKSEEGHNARKEKVVTDTTNTTSTLPLEEVLGKIDQQDEETSYKVVTRKRLKIALIIAAGALLIAGITIFAIIAFGGK